MDSPSDAIKFNEIITYLKAIESRISRLEAYLNIDPNTTDEDFKLPPLIPPNISERAASLENQIGQFWFAKAGIIILCIGIAYLLSFPFKNVPSGFISLSGYILIGILFWLARSWENSRQLISQYIFGSSLVLLYFITLRLHFFGTNPIIKIEWAEVLVLSFLITIHLFIAYKRKSVYLSATGITLAMLTCLLGNNTYSVSAMLILLAIYIVFLKRKFEWKGLFIYGIALIYLTNLFWMIGNPILGNPIALQGLSSVFLLSLLIDAVILSFGNLSLPRKTSEDGATIVSSLLNGIFSYLLFLIISIVGFKNDLPAFHTLASVVYIVIAAVFWLKHESKYATFFYSILGYCALSVAIIAQFSKPDFFIWLCWQSLIVVSTAIWFRSKIIIVANFLMFLIIFFSYLAIAGTIGIVTLSFGFVALITARILNWQKNRLDLKTEMMRIAYLVVAFFIFPYALFHIVPEGFVALSWTIVAILYYVMSMILKNKKYRWMSILTFLLTVLYILFVGTINLEPVFRIISFIVLGIVLLVVSMIYGKVKAKF